jgi:hypothetical protein
LGVPGVDAVRGITEEEKRQLLHFGDVMERLLLEAWRQTKERLTAIYKAIKNGTYRIGE